VKKFTTAAGAGLTALAVGLALVGCGSDSSSESDGGSSAAETSSEATTAVAQDPPANPNETIQDFIGKNGLQETAVKPGEAGVPTVNLPLPPGWQRRDDVPEAPFGAFFFPGSAVPTNPPRILVLMSKLTGEVNPDVLLEYAPGELRQMPGFQATSPDSRGELMGFPNSQSAGTYTTPGGLGVVAQKTVVIPADDGAYVLQLNAYAADREAPLLMQAIQLFDQQMAIIV
jgi:hypothetical protein